MSNSLNYDKYASFKSSYGIINPTTLTGVNLKVSVNSKYPFLDYFAGTMFMVGPDGLSSDSWVSGNTASSDYVFNGGGVYAGISPKLKSKHFGLTSEFAIGVFSFKEYQAIFNNQIKPEVDYYEKKASAGLGAMSSIGFYVRFWRIGINPSINAVFSGSSSASFLFYGFTIPLSFQF